MAGSTVTVEALAQWLGITMASAPVTAMLTECLDGAVEAITERVGTWVEEPWPKNVQVAVTMQAARLYKRRNSPEGVTGFGDLGVVRVTGIDPDIEAQLGPALAYHFA